MNNLVPLKPVVIDSLDYASGLVLAKMLHSLFGCKIILVTEQVESEQTELDGICKVGRQDVLNSLLNRENFKGENPWLIIQFVASNEFYKYEVRDLTFSDSNDRWDAKRLEGGHPLTYRLTVDEFKKLQKFPPEDTMLKKYGEFTLPVIFLSSCLLQQDKPEVLFFDSSIWHRHFSFCQSFGELVDLIKQMAEYHVEKRYELTVALEHIDYSIKMFRSNRLCHFSHAHGGEVSLHWFQSEALACKEGDKECRILLERSKKSCNGDGVLAPNWRFLLVDDFASIPLKRCCISSDDERASGKVCNGVAPLSKGSLIHHAIFKKFPSLDGLRMNDGCACIYCRGFTCVKSIAEAKDILLKHNGMYDVILLDYLLARSSETGNREKGIALIDWLRSDDSERNRGPAGRFWVFPVSAFASAFLAEMQRGGIETFGDKCVVAVGADPVCTPELFRWQLFQFLIAQYDFCAKGVDLDKQEDLKTLYKYVTQNFQRLINLPQDKEHGSRISEIILDKGLLAGCSTKCRQILLPYLLNYLRLRLFHWPLAKEMALKDLKVIQRLLEKENALRKELEDEDVRGENFSEWLKNQEKEILSVIYN